MTYEPEPTRVIIGAPGDLSTVTLAQGTRRAPGPGEVEIAVAAAALNFKDVLLGLGLLEPAPDAAGQLGSECAGVVAAVGPDVTLVSVGEPVVALGRGCLARYVTVSERAVARVPSGLGMIEAATLPAALVTVDYALVDLGRLRRGERILIHAGAGGIGLAALQAARRIGAEVYATAGSEAKRAFLIKLGVRHVADSRSIAFAEQIMEMTGGRGVDVVLNSLAGPFIERSLSVLAPGGRMVELGVRDIQADTPLRMGVFRAGISLCAVADWSVLPHVNERLPRLLEDVGRGYLAPLPHAIFPSSAAPQAFSYLAMARHIGKVVLTWSATDGSLASTIVPPDFVRLCTGSSQDRVRNPFQVALSERILSSEGAALFELALASDSSQILVSTTDLGTRLGSSVIERAADMQSAAAEATSARRRGRLRNAFAPPQTDLEKALAAQWQAALAVEQVGVHDDFFALGGDSLLAVQLLAQARRELGLNLPPHSLVEAPTIAALLRSKPRREQAAQRQLPETLVCLREGSGGPPLILLHPVGGQVYVYRDLAALLPQGQSVYGVRARPLRKGGVTPSVPELADSYLADLLALQPQGPYLLGGSSFGGILAYEIARRLIEKEREVGLLAMLDAPGPGYMPVRLDDDVSILGYLLSRRSTSPEELSRLRALSREALFTYFLERGRTRPGPLHAESVAEMEALLELWRANQRALWNYTPPPYPGRIVFFAASEIDGVNAERPDRAWRALADGGMEVHSVPGSHITMNYPPNIGAVASVLRLAIARALKP